MLDFIGRNRSLFVLKPNDDYGGHGVYFGSQLDEREWESAIETALSADYIVQDALDLRPEVFPVFSAAMVLVSPPRQSSTSLPVVVRPGFLFCKNSARAEWRLQFAEMSLQQLRLAVTQSLKERAFEFTLPLRDAGG